MNPLKELGGQGQSIWLDYIRRNLIRSGELKRMVDEDGIRGVTSNPTIFEKAIAGSTDYDEALRAMLARDGNAEVEKLYEPLAIEDIQMAADVLRPVYDASNGDDGYVSLEVSPHLAHDTQGTIAAAKRLRAAVDRPNLMIKVPATPAGIPAIEQLIADGLSINVTLMFSMSHYEAVARAYVNGLERCADPSKVASVASFFVSRVDTVVDKELEKIGSAGSAARCSAKSPSPTPKSSIAASWRFFTAKDSRHCAAAARGCSGRCGRARERRIRPIPTFFTSRISSAPETVNTLPPDTINAFRDHGKIPGATVKTGFDDADAALATLAKLGINLDAITEKLQVDGVASFSASFDQLMGALEKKREAMAGAALNHQELHLGKSLKRVEKRLKDWQTAQVGKRIWEKDHKVWSKDVQPELADRLGWLELPETMEKEVAALRAFADKAKADGMKHVVLLGMGGSSLAPEVFQETFGNAPGYPKLRVLDSTHPAAVKAVENGIDLAHTVFLVSSKSGTTTETNSFFFYFWDKLKKLGADPGPHFVAITDPGTPLEQLAKERNFRGTFNAPAEVGGRYSALTMFGLVPAALIGVDIGAVLARARRMSAACGAAVADAKQSRLDSRRGVGRVDVDQAR